MKNRDFDKGYKLFGKIPNDGYLEHGSEEHMKWILEQVTRAAKDSLSVYLKGSSSKPGTIPHQVAVQALLIGNKLSNPNAVDAEMFRGSHNVQRDYISMISRLFGKTKNDEPWAGLLLSGGTECINQIVWILRNKYFFQQMRVNVRTSGLNIASMKADFISGKNSRISRPRILAPVNSHYALSKAADIFGMGADSISYYALDSNFEIDEDHLRYTIKRIYDQDDEIIFSFACGGDTMRGKVHNIHRLSEITREISEQFGKKSPPIIVDSAGSFMFVGVMKNNESYDGRLHDISFNIPDVQAIIGDPHKQPIPYSCGLLMLKNMNLVKYTDIRAIKDVSYLDMDENNIKTAAAFAAIPGSRSGSLAFAAWAYVVYQGMSGLRREKEKIWSLVKKLRNYINGSSEYSLVCEPETQVVSFRYTGEIRNGHFDNLIGQKNIEIYKNIKNHDDYCYVSKDGEMMVRTPQQLMEPDKTRYTGLFVTIMEHNTDKHIDALIEILEKEAFRLKQAA